MNRSDLKPGFNITIHKKNKKKIPLIVKIPCTIANNQVLHKNTRKKSEVP